jgi:hypothetical protein
MTPGSTYRPATLQPPCLGREPRLGLRQGILRLPFGSPKTKSHLDVAPVKRRRVYYKGEGGGFPQVRAMVSLVNPRSHVARLSTK